MSKLNVKDVDLISTMTNQIKEFCEPLGFELVSNYINSNERLTFKHKATGILHYNTWNLIQNRQSLSLRNNKEYYTYKIHEKLKLLNFHTDNNDFFFDKKKINIVCNKCDKNKIIECNKILHRLSICSYCTKSNNRLSQIKHFEDLLTNIGLSFGFEFLNDFKLTTIPVTFKHIETGILQKILPSNLFAGQKLCLTYNSEFTSLNLQEKLNSINFSGNTDHVINKKCKIIITCNKCGFVKNIKASALNLVISCSECSGNYKPFLKKSNVLKNPYILKYLYFIKFNNDIDNYKIGLYNNKNIKSRFSGDKFNYIDILYCKKYPLYISYYLEQIIIKNYKKYKYTGKKFNGWTECFNNNLDYNNVLQFIEFEFNRIKDLSPTELMNLL